MLLRHGVCGAGGAAALLALVVLRAAAADEESVRTSTLVAVASVTQPGGVAAPQAPAGALAVTLKRTEHPPRIDGVLNEGEWDNAAVITNFTQVDPDEGASPTERTEVRLLYDDNNLYVLFRCFDSDPIGILARELQRDTDLSGSDRVSFVIDTFNDDRNGFFFQTNPAGARRDALVEEQRNLRFDWDGVWYERSGVDDEGWVAEFRIPFKTLSFDPRNTTWGFNASRFIRRRNEDIRWAAPTHDRNLISLSEAGDINGLKGIAQGLGLDVKPSFTVRNKSTGSGFRRRIILEPSLDIFYKPSPFLTAALTLNTDFAETEVDDRQVNLTRFPLFFPEKRAFFLQDAGIFDFASIRRSPLPFFSRRIGIGAGGKEKDIVAGIKLTGRAGNLNFGLLDVKMDNDPEVGAKNFTIGRFSLNLLGESSVGAIFTNGDPRTSGNNSLVGADFNYRNSKDFGDAVVTGTAWFEQTFSRGASRVGDGSDESAFGLRAAYNSDTFRVSLNAEQIGANINPALGFVRRRGVRQFFSNIRRRWRYSGAIKRFDIQAAGNFVTDLSGDTESIFLSTPEVFLETRAGDVLRLEHIVQREVLTAPFKISDGVVIPVGDYRWNRFEAELSTSSGRPIAFSLEFKAGGFFDGSRFDTIYSLQLRPSAKVFASVEFERNDIKLEEGDFATKIGRARINISFSPDVTWSNLIQYDNISNTLGLNSRIKWILTPGNEVFFVVNQGFDVGDGQFRSVSTEISAKVGWTFRF